VQTRTWISHRYSVTALRMCKHSSLPAPRCSRSLRSPPWAHRHLSRLMAISLRGWCKPAIQVASASFAVCLALLALSILPGLGPAIISWQHAGKIWYLFPRWNRAIWDGITPQEVLVNLRRVSQCSALRTCPT